MLFETWDMLTGAPIFYVALGVVVILYVLRHPEMVATLRELLALLDTNGGHILTLCGFVWLAYKLFQTDQTAGGQIMTGAWAALLVLLNVRREKPAGASSQVDTTTTVTAQPGQPSSTQTTAATTIQPAQAVPVPAAAAAAVAGGAEALSVQL